MLAVAFAVAFVGTMPAASPAGILSTDRGTYWMNFALNFTAEHRDIVRVPHKKEMNGPLLDSWTVEAWVLPSRQQKHPASGIIMIVGFLGRHPVLGMTADGYAVAQLKDVNKKDFTYTGTTNLLDGRWHHVAATFDGRENDPKDYRLYIYVDGKLDFDVDEPKRPGRDGYQKATECADQSHCEEGMHIGGLYCCMGAEPTGHFFTGLIDEVRVWSREVGQPELIAHMSQPLNGQDQDQLLFYFPFDDAGMEFGMNVVDSKAWPWKGLLGTPSGVSRPTWVHGAAPLKCPATNNALVCVQERARLSAPDVVSRGAVWAFGGSAGGKGYSLFTILAAVLSTVALTSTLASILTHAFITGRVVLPPGLSNLSNILARVLPGSDYRRTTTTGDDEHRGDWTWAQPARKETTLAVAAPTYGSC